MRFDFDLAIPPEIHVPAEVIAEELRKAGATLHRNLRYHWPEKSGKSRRAWKLDTDPSGFLVTNDARNTSQKPYSGYIKGSDQIISFNMTQTADNAAKDLASGLPSAILREVKHG